MLPTAEGLNQDSELEENKFFFSHIFLPVVGFGCLLLFTILERDSQIQKSIFPACTSEGKRQKIL